VKEESAMPREVKNAREMSFVEIGETYPDDYILVQIVEIDHSKGRERGIPLFASRNRGELTKVEMTGVNTMILPGDGLIPGLGGLI
jgi:hypothetical protein